MKIVSRLKQKGEMLVVILLLFLGMLGCNEVEKESSLKKEVKQSIEYETKKINLEKRIIKKGIEGKNEVIIGIAATTDVHGRIYPYEYAIGEEDESVGFTKTNSVVKELRKTNPNLLLIDIGDTVQDNNAELFNDLEIHPMVKALNIMKYDAWILGNHEFNFKKEFIEKNIRKFKGAVISANILNEDDGSNFVLPYQIFDIEGVRVAVIGVLPPHVPKWEASSPENFKGLKFENPLVSIERTVKEIEGKYDVLVGAFHLDRKNTQDSAGILEIVKKVPKFDIVFAGHEHARYVLDMEGVPIISPGSYGWGVSFGKLKLKKINDKWKIEYVEAKNIETKNYKADEELKEQFKDVHEESLKDSNQVIGEVAESFISNVDNITGKNKVTTLPTSQIQDNAVIELINEVQKFYAKADVSAAAIFDPNSNLKKGIFKKKDVAFIYKYTNTLVGVNMTGENLLKYMEWSVGYYNKITPGDVTISFNKDVRGYNYDMFDGIQYDVDISMEPGKRIKNVTINGKKLEKTKNYKVAVNNYRLGTLQTLKLINLEDKYYDSYEIYQDGGRIRELIIKYVKEELKGKLVPKIDNNWKIIGKEKNIPRREEVIEKIRNGEIIIQKSEDGRTLNIESINIKVLD